MDTIIYYIYTNTYYLINVVYTIYSSCILITALCIIYHY